MHIYKQIVVAISAIVLTGVALAAQTKPDFSGTWAIDRDKTSAMGPAAGSGGGVRMSGGGNVIAPAGRGAAPAAEWTITQTAATLTIVRPLTAELLQKFVYRLDGSESVNTNVRTTWTTKSHWEGGVLITEGTQVTKADSGDVSRAFKERRFLAPDGSMHIETTTALPNEPAGTMYQALVKKGK